MGLPHVCVLAQFSVVYWSAALKELKEETGLKTKPSIQGRKAEPVLINLLAHHKGNPGLGYPLAPAAHGVGASG